MEKKMRKINRRLINPADLADSPKTKKSIRVYSFVDHMACEMLTQDEEYLEIKSAFVQAFPDRKVIFKKEIPPFMLENQRCEFYVFDYGGVLPGCSDLVNSFFKNIFTMSEEHPNTLFIIYSTFTFMGYKNWVENEIGEYSEKFNVVVMSGIGEDEIKQIQDWMDGQP